MTFIQNQINQAQLPRKQSQNYKSSFLSTHLNRTHNEDRSPQNKNKSIETLSPTGNKTAHSYNQQNESIVSLHQVNPNNKNFEVYFADQNNLNAHNQKQMEYYPPYRTIKNDNYISKNDNYINKNDNFISKNENYPNKAPKNNKKNESQFNFNNDTSSLNNETKTEKIIKTKLESKDKSSCPHCEEFYKMTIMNSLPLKILKCIYCNNLINAKSLEFYLSKYKDELVKRNLKKIREQENWGGQEGGSQEECRERQHEYEERQHESEERQNDYERKRKESHDYKEVNSKKNKQQRKIKEDEDCEKKRTSKTSNSKN